MRDSTNDHAALWGAATVAAFLAIWELAPLAGLVNPLFVSSPSRIVVAGVWLFAHGLWRDIWVSLSEFLWGFGLAVAVGIPAGVVLGWFSRPRAMFEPFVVVLNSVPRVALLPILILWLGIGIASKVAVVFLGAVFPIVMTVMSGIRNTDDSLITCARAFGGDDWQVLRTVALPGSVPMMVAGMRVGTGRALVGVVVGELVASQAGIGHMMSTAGATFQTDRVFVGVALLALFGFAVSAALGAVESRVDSWRVRR